MAATHTVHSAEAALERLPGLPGGAELLSAAKRRDDLALVGGAVRDLLLGHWPRELDVTVARDAAGLAASIAASISPSERPYGHAVEPVVHDRFGTASVAWAYGRIDIAERRAESYAAAGALPDVRPGTVEEDLARRDFTVNAIALALRSGAGAITDDTGGGPLRAVDGALDDLAAGRLRVLHDASFEDDPTRILRLARYSARLGFEIDAHTRELVGTAVAGGALQTVSGGRIGAELWLAVHEAGARASLRALDDLGVLAALGMPSPFDDALAAQAEALLPADGRRDVLRMAIALRPGARDQRAAAAALTDVTDSLEFTREQAGAVLAAASGANELAELLVEMTGGAGFGELEGSSVEKVAIAAAIAGPRSERALATAQAWFETQRHVKLEIDGNDLLAAGVRAGPEVGARLRQALRRKREGIAENREQELRAALDGDVEERRSIER